MLWQGDTVTRPDPRPQGLQSAEGDTGATPGAMTHRSARGDTTTRFAGVTVLHPAMESYYPPHSPGNCRTDKKDDSSELHLQVQCPTPPKIAHSAANPQERGKWRAGVLRLELKGKRRGKYRDHQSELEPSGSAAR